MKEARENFYSTPRKHNKTNTRKGSGNGRVLRYSTGFWSTKLVRMDLHLSFFVSPPCFSEVLSS